jgi:hypothetical protein
MDRENVPVVQRVDRRSLVLWAHGAALVGGTIGWIVAFSGLDVWGLGIGLAATAIVLAAGGRAHPRIRFATLAAFAFLGREQIAEGECAHGSMNW